MPYLPLSSSTIPPHYSSAVSDSSSSSCPPPQVAFAEREGFDDLSASFKSLYKSIFGHSVNSGEYINAPPPFDTPPIPATSSDFGGSGTSLPLGASAASLFNTSGRNYSPQFTSLMDSFRDIAETNSWDKLDPAHIQSLMESFKAGEHTKLGLDPEVYSDLAASFNQFLSRLNNRFLTGNSSTSPHLGEYHQQQTRRHSGLSHMLARPHPEYSQQRDSMSPFHVPHASPPNSSFHNVRTPSPRISLPSHMAPMCGPMTSTHSHYSSFMNPVQHSTPTMAPQRETIDIPIKSVVTDLFDDQSVEDDFDDFDWTKLM